MNYHTYLENLKENHNIHLLAFVEEHIIFCTFLSNAIRTDQNITEEHKEELINIMKKAYKRLERKFKNAQENKDFCLKRHEELQNDNPRVSSYFKIIATLFYDTHPNEDPSSEFTSLELFFKHLNDIDESYPKQFHDTIIEQRVIVE